MSRSYRKHAFGTNCGTSSQKESKRCYNRIMRRVNRVALRHYGDDAVFVFVPEVMDTWTMPNDGPPFYAPFSSYCHQTYPDRRVLTYREWYRWIKAK